ncbi:DNA mismatch repair endonuclease MutH [Motilimonas pumila]|uniref:DNA mismatch repair endonuclease MutH n=1 Tax=Motilimonas pumila TaxID=2303987 RepID=UPI0018E0B272|nr:DNA mismatch repair endonuclease MutH [Motilimonas pumila]
MNISPPNNLDQLMQRALQIAGLSLGELAQQLAITVPKDLTRDKGWVGQLIELHLGASAGSKPEQDFPHLGIELKTIPINDAGQPLETTFVCVAPLVNTAGICWQNSNVRNKLTTVLWLPVQGSRSIPLADRIVGSPLLWQPDRHEQGQLQQDWEEIMELIALGKIESITARHGEVLQLRPKAANGKALTDAVGLNGQKIQTRPRGFYLKKDFTAKILQKHFLV